MPRAPQLCAMRLEVLAEDHGIRFDDVTVVDGNKPSVFLEYFHFELKFRDTPIHHLLRHVDFLRISFTGTGWYRHVGAMVESKTYVASCNSVDKASVSLRQAFNVVGNNSVLSFQSRGHPKPGMFPKFES